MTIAFGDVLIFCFTSILDFLPKNKTTFDLKMAATPSVSKPLTKDLTQTFFEGIQTVLFDADGVLWEGSSAIPG